MKLPVVWWAPEGAAGRGYWDQTLLAGQLDRLGADQDPTLAAVEAAGGAVIVVPGSHAEGAEQALSDALRALSWAVVVVTSNEEGRFDGRLVRPGYLTLRWEQYVRRSLDGAAFLPLGAPPRAWDRAGRLGDEDRPYDVAFVGQRTHARRWAAYDAVTSYRGPSIAAVTDRFAGGLPRHLYEPVAAQAKVTLCPSGPIHPDSFRMYEALEAGSVPIGDRRTADGADWSWWWDEMFPDRPFPVVDDWSTLDFEQLDEAWRADAVTCSAWWKRRKLTIGDALLGDAVALAGPAFSPPDWLHHHVTAVITMSPIPTHPDLGVLRTTVESIVGQLGADVRIVVACDGVRPEQEHLRDSYERALQRLLELAHHDPLFANVSVLPAGSWGHQANLTRRALAEVHTPCLLFVEHDTPLVTDEPIPWWEIVSTIEVGVANTVRLHHEAHVLDEHRYLMVGDSPQTVNELPLWQCRQWSQRPHVSSTRWYREMLDELFPPSSRTMIEDLLHGVVQDRPWEWSKLWLYAPPENMKRSLHLDGRAGGDKFDMRFS